MSNVPAAPTPDMSQTTRVLVLIVASIGFLFDTYELLMLPVIGREALSDLLSVSPDDPAIKEWVSRMLYAAAFCGGIFGLMGGFLIDQFGRKRVMVASILLYSFSPLAAAFSTSAWMLLVFRCTTFIGICVEFVAAITWLAELFDDPRMRRMAIGWTQAFASVGGIVVTNVDYLMDQLAGANQLPTLPVAEGFNGAAAWRFTLLTGLVPGALILCLMPFVPESRAWLIRKRAGTLQRPRFGELFHPRLIRTTLIATVLSACAYAAAFGALQLTPPVIVKALPSQIEIQKKLTGLEKAKEGLTGEALAENVKAQKTLKTELSETGSQAQNSQEFGGLAGRILLAILVVVIVSHRNLLRVFVIPGLIFFPLTYYYFIQSQPDLFIYGVFICGLCTVAQFSYFGEYLPKAFPLHLRGTGGSFATNVGGRMIGTSASLVTTAVVAPMLSIKGPLAVATAAAIVAGSVYFIAFVLSFFLPVPAEEVK